MGLVVFASVNVIFVCICRRQLKNQSFPDMIRHFRKCLGNCRNIDYRGQVGSLGVKSPSRDTLGLAHIVSAIKLGKFGKVSLIWF
jgi:hypothetical protein